MKKSQKIFYAIMFIFSILALISSLVSQNYSTAGWVFTTIIWIDNSYIKEMMYEQKIKELKDYQNGITETKN